MTLMYDANCRGDRAKVARFATALKQLMKRHGITAIADYMGTRSTGIWGNVKDEDEITHEELLAYADTLAVEDDPDQD